MIARLAAFLEDRYNFSPERTALNLRRVLIALAGLTFWLSTSFIIAADSIVPGISGVSSLRVGAVAPRDIVAPNNSTFTSDILTDAERQRARDNVEPVLSPPDPERVQQQTELASEILTYMRDVRRATYDTTEQKIEDINAIQALDLDSGVSEEILRFDEETWADIENEVLTVLPRVMRSVRESEVAAVREQLPTQVAVRFNANERRVIVAIIEDLVIANRLINLEATEDARDAAAASVSPVPRSFVTGERIVEAGSTISASDYEALEKLGLLRTDDRRAMDLFRAMLATIIVMVIANLYFSRLTPQIVNNSPGQIAIQLGVFLLMLLATRFLGIDGNMYLFPVAALALIYVAIADVHVAIVASLALGLLTGVAHNSSLEVATLVTAGSLTGALALRNPGRLNAFFISGFLVGLVNAATISLFALATSSQTNANGQIIGNIAITFLSGMLLVPAAAIAVMYVLTTLFNLPTALRLMELSQPNKPLLQRLMREAPGTYQHSLQVANLAEQAASAIGADSQLTHVSALYHDIGKMSNPLYFTENQQEHIGNPHDTLNDPARSADIIINHVIEGDEMARQNRLPQRMRDFIREHHGTTMVYVFYQRALQQVNGDESQLDKSDFRYPGPRPQSKETGILMLADSCEAAVRSAKPESKGQISQIVKAIFNDKRETGQLDESGLTLNDLYTIETIFLNILQSMFHPRINYREAIQQQPAQNKPKPKAKETIILPRAHTPEQPEEPQPKNGTAAPTAPKAKEMPVAKSPVVEERYTAEPEETEALEEAPMTEVPRLPSLNERKTTQNLKRVEINEEETARPNASDKSSDVDSEADTNVNANIHGSANAQDDVADDIDTEAKAQNKTENADENASEEDHAPETDEA
ncbi:HDIG domain-containing protein [Phototrophicus methaneseepsis]|uniref:HDIG domain-containing protein n=1 Tax=Phototrophicus methaneseepsis TaxID=2710758 RepID=A0A7S8EDK4_9CHLR|nr:HDIG domain-containing metalloprotein [Phototrophicus methaneseepsis]QPC84874.1 HDIG domain-containing protein [Phototrophicus methaneseepsis]